ncbi:MAG: hypothetical protein WDZ53_01665, partial [Balneolales bacterium]
CLGSAVEYQLKKRKEKVEYYLKNHALQRVRERAYRLNEHVASMDLRLKSSIRYRQLKFSGLWNGMENRLSRADPREALLKGFARIIQDDQWIRSSLNFDSKRPFRIQWKDGEVRLGSNSG